METDSVIFYPARGIGSVRSTETYQFRVRVRVHKMLDNFLCKDKCHQLGCNCDDLSNDIFSHVFFEPGFQTGWVCEGYIKHLSTL
jgi:hypothetical protein